MSDFDLLATDAEKSGEEYNGNDHNDGHNNTQADHDNFFVIVAADLFSNHSICGNKSLWGATDNLSFFSVDESIAFDLFAGGRLFLFFFIAGFFLVFLTIFT